MGHTASPDMPKNIIDENDGAESKMDEFNSKPLENVRNVKKKPKLEECWNWDYVILVEKAGTMDS